ncbi:small subunit processome component 20 homolog isoform X2 [Panicum virgatum]|uniref:small subunit processome component 20 homolog isoform X2 n=1 Tax=Panicum virgatum TaxID=38727 RepID=UPI0019D56657|nr:small subunit processome component 20 homolog isoform X2 [Panicum virgatum]
MATPSYAAVKCLNTCPSSRKRFSFKTFSQRVEEIDIDVYRSLHAVKAEPSSGSSFFIDALVEWRELNTAEDFISFYEEMIPLVQTLPQIVLHREKLFSALLLRVNMSARLSLEPILMLITALSRDILEDFLSFLGRYANAILALLNDGGDRDPEILEQVFTSWSYIMMYLQKYLVKDIVQILRTTSALRYFPKDYVREFMAESVSFLLRNAPNNQLAQGLMKLLLEAAKKSSPVRTDGVISLLWHVMKGTSTKLHSRAGKVLKFLLSKSTFTTIHDKFPDGSSTIHDVMTGLIQRLCDEVDPKELPLIYTCLFEEINNCLKDGCLEHLKCLIDLLAFALQKKQNNVFDKVKMIKLLELLVGRYVLPGSNLVEASSSEVLGSVLDFLLCVLDVPIISSNLSIISPFYGPVFELTNLSVIVFIKKLLAKGPQIIQHFESQILSAMGNFLASSPEDVLFILLHFFKESKKQIILHSTDANHLDSVEKVCKFFESKFSFWIELLDDTVKNGNRSSNQVTEEEAAILWGSIRCYPNINDGHQDSLSLLKKLICNFDRLLEVGEENVNGLSKTTWRSLLGAALSSYHELLVVNANRNSELSFFILLAKSHSTCPQVLSAVAEYLDSLQGVASLEVTEEFDPQNLLDLLSVFDVNLSSPNKDVRISTLRILSYFVKMDQRLGTNEERPHKRQRTEDSGEETVAKYTNVLDTLLTVESTQISVSTSRKIAIFISRIQMSLSSKMVHDDYISSLLHGIIGILYNRFSDLWPPTLDCLAVLVRKHKELVWSQFVQFVAIHQSKGLTVKNQEKLEPASQPQSIFDCFSLYLATDFDCTPVETMATLLLQSLQRIPDVAESRSRHLVPLFLKFMGYDDGSIFSADSYMPEKCKGKQWKAILKEWLNLLKLMRNARSLYQSKVLHEVLTKRVLDDNDPDIQAKALDCLLNWKDEFLIPYSQNLKNLIDTKTLREEMTTWAVSHDSLSILKDHRSNVVPLVIRVLAPKVRKLKLLGSRKFDSNELQLFFSLLLKSLIPNNLQVKMFGSHSDNLLGNVSDIVGASTEICIENFTLKKSNGFLHLVEEIFVTFDMAHISPFLNILLTIVARLLESCTRNLKSDSTGKYPCNQSNGHDNDCLTNMEVGNSVDMDECRKEIHAVDHMESSVSIKQLKDLRSLCIKIVSSALSHYESHDFGENFWSIFFSSVKPLIKCFTQEASSSEKPSSLFACFMAMSWSPTLAPLLGSNNLVPAIFSILTVKTASGSITSYALEFIENLLRLDIDLEQQNDHSVKKILVPHMDVLIHSLHDFVNHRKELNRKSGTWLGQRELRLFKLLLSYITDPSAAENFIDLILPFFSKKDLNSDECLEALRVVKGIVPNLRCKVSAKVLNALNPLLATVGLEQRLCICDIYDGLSLYESSMSFLAGFIRDLNAVSTSELGELDYDTRLNAYDKVKPQMFLGMTEEHVGAILSHCVYDMSSEELIFRQSASRALQSFLDFSASVMNNDESKYSVETADDKSGENNSRNICTMSCIEKILEKTYLHNMGVAMTKDVSIQKEWIILLREMVFNINHLASLSSFRPLCKEDTEEDFFHNITHLQAGKRSKALSLFRQGIKENNFSEDITMKVFVPLFFNMFSDVKAGKGEQVRDVCLDTLSAVAAKVQWEYYRTILTRCFRELNLKPDKQKIILRLICSVLDAFHFMKPANDAFGNSDAMTEDNDSSITFSLTKVSSDKQDYLRKVVFPQVQKLLGADPEKVNVNINLVALKILKLLPVDYFESQLSSVIHRICNFLKNRLESIRDEARSALAASLKELGIGYLQFVVKILRAILKRGFELHVLGYTLHYLLSKNITADMNGRLDYCLEDLLAVVSSDLFGDVAEQKEVEKIASKMKETKKRMSFETLKLIAQSITFSQHLLKKLISPVSSHLQKQLTPKLKTKLEMILHNIALGIECNPSTETSNLFTIVYWLIKDTATGSESESKENTQFGPGQDSSVGMNFPGIGESGSQNSYILTKFALDLLRNRLKSIKLDKEDEQLLKMLDPFVDLLGECLNSKYESVLSVAFRCLALLVKLPLPSLRDNANNIKNVLMDIAQRAGNSNGHLVTSCLKLLADLLRGFRISLSDNQLQMLVHTPMFVDLQTNPSPVALSLLKAIVRRKLVSHEIYDIVVKIGELMVTTPTESIRQQCIQILLQFFLNYPLSEKRLQQHIDFFLANLSYEHPSGREAVLEMLHDILTRFPQRIVDDQGQTFFLHLVVALANEQHQNVSSMILRTIQKLLVRIGDQGKNSIFEYSLSWYTGEKQSLWSPSAQVIGLLIDDHTLRMGKHLKSILAVAKTVMESSAIASGILQSGFSDECVLPLWKEAYHSVAMMERLLLRFPELYFEQNMEEIWIIVCKLLIHPHSMLRSISSSLVASYFATVEKRKREQKLVATSWLLVQPSRLFIIAVSFLKQLRTELSDTAANNLIVQNLAYSVCNLHTSIRQSTSTHQFWSSISSSDHSALLEGFELLGSTKAKNVFLLCTSTATDVSVSSLDSSEEPKSLLVSSILKSMGKIAMQMQDTQTKIVFNCFRMISSALGSEESLTYADHLLAPLYKVSEGLAGKVVSDEVKQLAEGVQGKLRDLIGPEKFAEVYRRVYKGLKQKRDSRKQTQKIIAAVDPERHAKRKKRIADKHREHKRRKIMAMKMGRWMR